MSLTVTIYSFSYKKGIPSSPANGGGYVFDCRQMHNPGRYEQFRNLSGNDEPVKRFLEERGEAGLFLESVYALVDTHVRNYLERGFTDLMVCFGCTGGQHRSVYCANRLSEHLRETFAGVDIELVHRELNGSGLL